MGSIVTRAGLIAVALLAGCPTPNPDPVRRAIEHGREAGDTVGGPDAGDLRGAANGGEVPPTWWVGQDPPEAERGYAMVLPGKLWRRREPVDAARVAVNADQLPDGVAGQGVVRGLVQHGATSPGGELVATLFVQPPVRMPRRACVALGLDDRRLDVSELLQGRGAFVPGAGPRPVFAHRIYRPFPQGWPVGTYDVQVELSECGSAATLVPAQPVSLTVAASGVPTSDQLVERAGVLDPQAEWARPRGRKESIHRGPDGSLEVRPAPPLPRVLRGDAFGVVVLGPLDPSEWALPDGTVRPLDPLGGLLTEADAGVLSWDAVAARTGEPAVDTVPRRVAPEMLGHAAALDVQGILFSTHGSDAGAAGLTESAAAARALGMRSDGHRVDLDVGEGDNAVSMRIIHLADGADLQARIAAARQEAGEALLLVEIDGSDDPVATAQAIAAGGADGGWIVADGLGPVWLRGGVPVLLGVPALDGAHRQAFVARWYVARTGVVRVDLESVVAAGDRWKPDRQAAGRQAMIAAALETERLGAWLAVGQNVAGIDVRAHGPDRNRTIAQPVGHPALETAELPPAELPPRCRVSQPPAGAAPRPVTQGLQLLSARLTDAEGPVIEAELIWRTDGPLPAGRTGFYVDGIGVPWRGSAVPCDGSWGFDRFRAGELVRDRVRLRAPDEAEAGEGTLWLDVRLGNDRPTIGGERRVSVGTITLP